MFKSTKNTVTSTSTEKKAGGIVTSTRTVTTTIKTTSGGTKSEVIEKSVIVNGDKNISTSTKTFDSKFPTSAFQNLSISQKPVTYSSTSHPISTTSKPTAAPTVRHVAPAPTVKPVACAQTVKPVAPKSIKEFAKEALDAHNAHRKKHRVPLLKLNQKICDYAQEWANHLAATNSFSHRPSRQYGENIFTKGSSDPNFDVSGKEATDNWYSEIKDYQFGGEPRILRSGHFTQVVWRSCTEFGIGKARTKGGNIVVVANYNPPGNMGGQYKDNVLPPK